MDDEKRKNGTEASETKADGDKAKEKDTKKSRRTPSPPSRSERSRSKSRSRERGGRRRRSRSRSRGYSPDRRRGGRFRNRGGGYGGYRDNFRRSPDRTRGRNGRNIRRSRSQSFDRYRNRRNNRSVSRDHSRSRSLGRPWKKGPMSPSSPSQNDTQPMPSNNSNFGMVAPPPPYGDAAGYNNFPPQTNMPAYIPASNNYPVADQSWMSYQPSQVRQDTMMQPPPNAYTSYPPPNIMQPIPPGDDFQQPPPQTQPPPSQWANVPPPPIINMQAESNNIETDEEKQKREAAVALEKKNQRATFRKQRDDYQQRSSALKRELKILKEQREELNSGSRPPSPTTNGFLKENDRLQVQIETKIKTMENVIDMLTGIIGADESPSASPIKPSHENVDPRKKKTISPKSDDSSPERLKTKVMESLQKRKIGEHGVDDERVNYTFFDPELHWCKTCEVFPKTAKDFLNHLHSEEHKAKDKAPETPWHDTQQSDDLPTYTNAPTKRTPIRGIQFFVPSAGWFCKLCSVWMGDLHCASSHLKSRTHAQKYTQFVSKNARFEAEWTEARQRAFDSCQIEEKFNEDVPPPPPIISVKPPPQVLESIPLLPAPELRRLGRNLSAIENVVPLRKPDAPALEESSKKGKKKKKEKKKRKKSKKKRQQSSSSGSSTSSESDSDSSDRKVPTSSTKEALPFEVAHLGDTSNSIRVAMRNANKQEVGGAGEKAAAQEEDENVGGKWTVIQEGSAKPIAPMPPTISANGEAQNRRDELIISQWNAPEPIISEKEKLLLEQLKGRLKSRETERKKEEPPQQSSRKDDDSSKRSNKDANDDSSRSSRHEDNRRDDTKRRRERSTSRNRSLSRGRYRGRRSRSPSSHRRSRSPRRDYRRRSRSRSHSRNRRIEKPIVRLPPEFKPRVTENDKNREKRSTAKSSTSSSSSKKPSSSSSSTKKLPFIGRMPVFKKTSGDDDTSKKTDVKTAEQQQSEEQRLLNERKQQELKFQIQQKQQLVQQQQKQAEAYNLAYPGTFATAFNTHGSIHHILPPAAAEDYEELMPDPMQFVSLMTGVPPPPPAAEMRHIEQLHSEPVLPPGIDEEEAEDLEPLPLPPPPTKGGLPQDFQDALSIIFDKGVEKPQEKDENALNPVAVADESAIVDAIVSEVPMAIVNDDDESLSTFAPMDMDSQSQPELHHDPQTMDEQSQYMLYGSMTDKPLVFNDGDSIIATGQIIPTPPLPAQILDPTHIPEPTLAPVEPESAEVIEARQKRLQELEDLAMLGIDAEDVCI